MTNTKASVIGFAKFRWKSYKPALFVMATGTSTTNKIRYRRFDVNRIINSGVNLNYEPRNSKLFSKITKIRMSLVSMIQKSKTFIMKTYRNLYDKLCSIENLRLAFKKARKGKSKKNYVKEFESDLENNLLRLKTELEINTYEPRKLERFVIHDPRTRVVYASDFRDRIVHHAICNIIEPIFDKTFIFDSYANRKKKGTLAAIMRFDKFKRKVTQNGTLVKNAKDKNMVIGYVLKADIKHYFDTVDHETLMQIISRKIKDEKVLCLIKKILETTNAKYQAKACL